MQRLSPFSPSPPPPSQCVGGIDLHVGRGICVKRDDGRWSEAKRAEADWGGGRIRGLAKPAPPPTAGAWPRPWMVRAEGDAHAEQGWCVESPVTHLRLPRKPPRKRDDVRRRGACGRGRPAAGAKRIVSVSLRLAAAERRDRRQAVGARATAQREAGCWQAAGSPPRGACKWDLQADEILRNCGAAPYKAKIPVGFF
jgi:hypothetical protein